MPASRFHHEVNAAGRRVLLVNWLKGGYAMENFVAAVVRFVREEEGANGVEYALLAGLIAIAFTVGASALGVSLNTFLNNVSTCVTTPSVANCSTPFGG
jgi:Flp pilus assembly pilin Flp